MAKKKRTSKTSKGERANISRSIVKAVKASVSFVDKEMHIVNAWRKGKNPWVSVANVNGPSNRPFIRLRANAVYGDPRGRSTRSESND